MHHETTLIGLLQEQARQRGDHPAVIEGERTLSYAELQQHVYQVAAGLASLGVGPGDRVAIWLKNCLDWIALDLAVGALGAIVVPLNTRYKPEEVAYILRRSGASVLVAMDRFLGIDFLAMVRELAPGVDGPGAGALAPELPELRHVVCVAERSESLPPDVKAFAELGRRGAGGEETLAARAERVQPSDLAMILFTSGTTGFPKGAMLEHRNLVFAAQETGAAWGIGPDDRLLVPNPYFHVMGSGLGINIPLTVGAAVLPITTFAAEEALELIHRHRVTVITGTPSMYQMMIEHPRFAEFDVSSLRVGLIAGAPSTPEFVRRVVEAMGFTGLTTGLGMTETAGGVTNTRIGDSAELVARTTGRAYDGIELRVVDPGSGNDVPAGERGELWVRGPGVMRGYYQQPEETAAALTAEGWYRSGDMVTMDVEGNLAVVGRLKDVFFCGGFNVYPAEVELCLTRHSAVAEAQVVGVRDHRLGEVGMAFVRLHEGATATEDELIAHCRERLANFKVPRYVQLVGNFPMTASGKIEKHRLREQGASLVEGRQGAPAAG